MVSEQCSRQLLKELISKMNVRIMSWFFFSPFSKEWGYLQHMYSGVCYSKLLSCLASCIGPVHVAGGGVVWGR